MHAECHHRSTVFFGMPSDAAPDAYVDVDADAGAAASEREREQEAALSRKINK